MKRWPLPLQVLVAWLICAVIAMLTLALYVPWWQQADGATLKPVISSVKIAPANLPASGGGVVLTAHLAHGATCQVKVLATQGLKVTVGKPFPCATIYKTLVKVVGKGVKNTVTLDLVVTSPDPVSATKVFYVHLAPAVVPPPVSVTTTTTPPVVVVPPGGGGGGGPAAVALDPTCTADPVVAYQMNCAFSLSAIGLSGGVLSFETTEIPNNPNAVLAVPATPGCTVTITLTKQSSVCAIIYPAAGNYEVATVYQGGPGAYSASQEEAVTVQAPVGPVVPFPTATVLTSTASVLGVSITDAMGPVATPVGTVTVQLEVYNASNGGLQATWVLTTTSVGQTYCDYGWSELHNIWTPSSDNCDVSGGNGPSAENGSDNFTGQAVFAGTSTDLPSASTQIVLAHP